MTQRLVEVALPVPLSQLFTYRLPPETEAPAGTRVRVPFGPRKLVGVVLSEVSRAPTGYTIREVLRVLDREPLLGDEELALARWIADYWFAPPGEAAALLLPPRMAEGAEAPSLKTSREVALVEPPPAPVSTRGTIGSRMAAVLEWLGAHGPASSRAIRKELGATLETLRRLERRGLVNITERRQFRDPLAGGEVATLDGRTAPHPSLTPAQVAAAESVAAAFGSYRGFLLHGVTGSGKTEVYLSLIERVLAADLGVVVLVPEIALTPQLVARFRSRLGDRVAVQHSGLDPAARHEQWLRIRAGELPVVVGARSALFSPIPALGLIVVDEEHEPSFKQESSPRYHGRDLALVRGHLSGVPVVLGSATPSLESWTNVAREKLTLLSLPTRAHTGRALPAVELIDMRTEPAADRGRLISERLLEALKKTIEAGEQAILFLNRRGYASSVQCRTCGEPLACRSCSVAYTWHRQRARLICHYCDESRVLPARCPRCGAPDLDERGTGTEQIEEVLEELLPTARLGRMDRDTTRGKALLRLLTRFRKRELDILVGTQMVAKGHDFPGVTLVGVLAAEQGLAFPDFRAAERTFQLLTQIAGRAGRGDRAGQVLMQTHLPDHYAIRLATQHDVTSFLDTESKLRQARGFPPTSHLALFRITGPQLTPVQARAAQLQRTLSSAIDQAGTEVIAHPPQPAPIERIKDRWRYQVLLRSPSRRALRAILASTRQQWETRLPAGLQIILDVDPIQFL